MDIQKEIRQEKPLSEQQKMLIIRNGLNLPASIEEADVLKELFSGISIKEAKFVNLGLDNSGNRNIKSGC